MYDLQWWLEKVQEDIDVPIEVASIDIVISESKCDLRPKHSNRNPFLGSVPDT